MVHFPRQQQFKGVPGLSPPNKGLRYPNLNYFLPLKRTFHAQNTSTLLTEFNNDVIMEQQIVKLDYVPPGSRVNFILCGTASMPGYANFDGIYQTAAGGEVGWYSGVLDGTETHMILEQRGFARNLYTDHEPFMRLSFVGLTAKYMDVGSGKGTPANTYGANGCPYSRGNITTGWPGLTVNKYGGVRCQNTFTSYSDSTSYSPQGGATFGTTTYSIIDIAGMKIRAYFGDNISLFNADAAGQWMEPAHSSAAMNTGIVILDYNRGGLSTQMYGFPNTNILNGQFKYIRYGYASQYQYSSGPPFGNDGNVYAHNFGCAIVEIVRNRGALGVTAS